MNGRGQWPVALVVSLCLVAAHGCELPMGQKGKTPVTLQLVGADASIIGDTVVLQVEAKDPQGRVLLEPPLVWEVSHAQGSADPIELLESLYGRAWIVGQYPSTARILVQVPPSDQWFTSNQLTLDLPVHYGPITIRFIDVGDDTVLTRQGSFELNAAAVDDKGRAPQYGEYRVTGRTGVVSVENISLVTSGGPYYAWMHLSADSVGSDTLVVTNTACYDPCADTLVVNVEPVALSLDLSASPPRSISVGDSIQMRAVVTDSSGFEIPGFDTTWRLAYPSDSTILKPVDASQGRFVSRANGTVTVVATADTLEASLQFQVHQEVGSYALHVPPNVVGVGSTVTARFDAWDRGGTPVDASITPVAYWDVFDTATAVIVDTGSRSAVLESRGYAATSVSVGVLQCSVVEVNCSLDPQVAPLRVIPEPDSVMAYPQDGSTMLGAIGTTATWLGNIYLPGETIGAVPLFWTSLDPDVATIDEDGTVTAVSVGTARIVGTMGAAADTAVVTVTG